MIIDPIDALFLSLSPTVNRQLATIVRATDEHRYIARTIGGVERIVYSDSSKAQGVLVFYDANTGEVLEDAPNVAVVTIEV